MREIDLRSAVFTCKPFDGDVFEVRDVNLINYPMGRNIFRVNDVLCSDVTVDGIDIREIKFVGIGASGCEVIADSVNSIAFNFGEGIYYIDNIPCKSIKIIPRYTRNV